MIGAEGPASPPAKGGALDRCGPTSSRIRAEGPASRPAKGAAPGSGAARQVPVLGPKARPVVQRRAQPWVRRGPASSRIRAEGPASPLEATAGPSALMKCLGACLLVRCAPSLGYRWAPRPEFPGPTGRAFGPNGNVLGRASCPGLRPLAGLPVGLRPEFAGLPVGLRPEFLGYRWAFGPSSPGYRLGAFGPNSLGGRRAFGPIPGLTGRAFGPNSRVTGRAFGPKARSYSLST